MKSLIGPCIQPPAGLQEWWPLDETSGTAVNNLIPHPIPGHGPDPHNGTSNPGAIGGTGPAPIAGMVGGALQFDGTDDFIEVSDGAGTLSHGNPTSNFTIDAWVKVNPGDASGVRPIVDKRFDFPDSQNPNVHTRGYAFYLFNGQLGFQIADDIAGLSQICDGGPPFTANCTNYVSTGPNIADGQWHHVAVTVQRTGTPEIRLYVDGNVVLTRGARTGNANSSIPLLIGAGYPIVISKPFFKGAIDEVEIFNRALDQSEIQAIFKAGPAGKCKAKPGEATADLGDAPDSTNHSGKAMDAYPTVPAKFPTVFDPATGLPQGPKHLQPKKLAWLGPDVSFENDADLLPDADGVTNIDPSANVADRDKFDDGVTLPIGIPRVCGQTQFQYTVTS
ncbi:MAG: LamG domain-containing protein, partial [Candidatus Bipolaricaulota bacterium]|nr:LamG domain-containing protein [Candidatus Bipolaricaulota bacterium]